VAVNLAGWEPNRSVLADTSHARTVGKRLAEAERRAGAGDPRGALAALQEALALEPHFALACKRAGDCWRALGERDAARAWYQRAVDCDGNPYRELSAQNEILGQVCRTRGVPVVDAPALLAAASPDGIVGDDFFWDNCHPTLSGYLVIARGFADVVRGRFAVTRPLRAATAADLETALGIDAAFQRQVLHGRGQYCYAAATLVHAPGPRLLRARRYLEEAAGMGPEDAGITCSLAVLTALEGDVRAALELWLRAWRLDAAVTRARADNRYVQQIMARRGVGDLLDRLRRGDLAADRPGL
jgi:tetratricopeptide (TPR) repeat protein